jgi:Flp pilus assembly protein TadD
MFRVLSRSLHQPRRAGALLALGLPLVLGGCMTKGLGDLTASIREPAPTAVPTSEAGLHRYTEAWGKRYEAHPDDRNTALAYAKGLRQSTQYAQAVAVLQRAAIKAPNDLEVLGAYGKALADAGRLTEAAEVLSKAHTPERPNWSILSAQGSVADQMGDHASAQELYQAALKIKPDEPSVLSNLGLSYALSKRLPQAEATLRQAADRPGADSRVRQNLSLVLALEGKFKEAEEIGQRDLPPVEAAENVTSIRKMIAQSNTWRELQKIDGTTASAAGRTTVRAASRQAPAPAAPRAVAETN